MRRPIGVALVLVAVLGLATAAQAGSSSYFSPKNRVISRASLAGVTPRSSWAAIQRAWGGEPSTGPAQSSGWGRHVAIWGTPGLNSRTAARALWARSLGVEPILFEVDLQGAEALGYALRTRYGDRLGTPARTFRRHWPRAKRVASGPDYASYVVGSSYRGWQLAFVFGHGRLKEAQLIRNDLFDACYRRTCPRGFPPR